MAKSRIIDFCVMDKICFEPIGIIHSDYKEPVNVPRQSRGAGGKGVVELFPEFAKGLKDLEKFSHIYLIFNFHRSEGYKMIIYPRDHNQERGLFATRSPRRPSAIGISIVKLVEIKGNKIFVEDIDIIEGSPLLDIKPYIEKYDSREGAGNGWLEKG